MAQPQGNRGPVISEGLYEILLEYLSFRHVFRHAYSFELKWPKMAPLVRECEQTFFRLETELKTFLDL